MKAFVLFLALISPLSYGAQKVTCTSGSLKLTVESTSPEDIRIHYGNEMVMADGYMDAESIDLIARLDSLGEMTLFAKIGKSGPDNYIFVSGKRNSVFCR